MSRYSPNARAEGKLIRGTAALFPEIQHPKKSAYVIALCETGNKTQAARAAGIHPATPYDPKWRNDLVFQPAVKQAEECGADLMESEAYRRSG